MARQSLHERFGLHSTAFPGHGSGHGETAGVKIDLVLRDMGYFSLNEFTAIEQRGAVVSS